MNMGAQLTNDMKPLSKYLLLGIVFVVVVDIVDLLFIFLPEPFVGYLENSSWVLLIGFGVGLLALWWTQESKKAWHIPVVILYGALVLLIAFYSIMLTHWLLGRSLK